MPHPEVRKGVMVDGLVGAQPAQTRLVGLHALQRPRRTHPEAVAINPQRGQQAGWRRRPARLAFAAEDLLLETGEIQRLQQRPNRPRRMTGLNQGLDIDRPQIDLRPVPELELGFRLLHEGLDAAIKQNDPIMV